MYIYVYIHIYNVTGSNIQESRNDIETQCSGCCWIVRFGA